MMPIATRSPSRAKPARSPAQIAAWTTIILPRLQAGRAHKTAARQARAAERLDFVAIETLTELDYLQIAFTDRMIPAGITSLALGSEHVDLVVSVSPDWTLGRLVAVCQWAWRYGEAIRCDDRTEQALAMSEIQALATIQCHRITSDAVDDGIDLSLEGLRFTLDAETGRATVGYDAIH